MRPPFKFSARTRVGFSDTDAQGIVYYGRYNPYFDLARVEYLRSIGQLHREAEGELRHARERRRVLRARAVRRRARDLRARLAHREDERHVPVRRVQDAGGPAARHRAPDARVRRPRGAESAARAGRLPSRRSSRSRATMSSTDEALEVDRPHPQRRRRRGRHPPRGRRRTARRRPATRGRASSSSRPASSRSARRPEHRTRRGARASRSIWQGTPVAELAVDDAPEEDRMFLERVAVLVSGYCLVGWDTGGESWEP